MKNEQYLNKKEIMEKITPLIENTLMRFDLIPVEIDLSKESHRWFLRIFMYSYNKNVSIDDCEKVTRSLGDFLDELIPFKYFLEVSSPGLDRKLKSEKEYVIFTGKVVDLKLRDEPKNIKDKYFKAKILNYDEKGFIKFQKYDTLEEFITPKENIISAKLCIDENRSEK